MCVLAVGLILFSKTYYDNQNDKMVAEARDRHEISQLKEKNMRLEKLNELTDSLSKINFNAETKTVETEVFKKLNEGERATIVFLGDSTTEQNDHITKGDPGHVRIIQTELEKVYGKNIDIINAGHAGDSIKDMLERLETSVIIRRPDIVVVNSGLNDERAGISNEEFKKTFSEVIDTIKEKTNADIYLRTSNLTKNDNANHRLENDINPIIRELSQELKIGYIDLYQYYKNVADGEGINKYNDDSIHPNGLGQQLIADIVLYTLLPGEQSEQTTN